ncbi:hypothetical protein D3C84_1141530 [compost metagenome]
MTHRFREQARSHRFSLVGWYCVVDLFYEDLAVPVWTSLPSSHSFNASVAEEANFAEGRIR